MKRVILPIAATLILVGCGSGNDQPEQTAVEPAQENVSETEGRREVRRRSETEAEPAPATGNDQVHRLPRLQGGTENDGHGLTMIVNGSSPEAFNESLELIASDSSESQYRDLDNALRYLRMYSPHGWGGAEALYAALDGMSGEEIIAKARERQSARTRGRGTANQ